MSKRIVCKFGGSSLRDAASIEKSMRLAVGQGARVIVVSAIQGTTNALSELCEMSSRGEHQSIGELIAPLRECHLNIGRELGATEEELREIEILFQELSNIALGMALLKDGSTKNRDHLLSFGELCSSKLALTALRKIDETLPVRWADARWFMKTDSNFGRARPQLDRIEMMAREVIDQNGDIVVTQGFIGSNDEGLTTTLGRGGSDYSASLMGEAINASEIQIWTDVAGVATTDPRLVEHTKTIEKMTFKEAEELAVFGAKVLHPVTLAPAQRKKIPVFVGHSQEPEKGGTWISREQGELPLVRASATRREQTLVTLKNPKMSESWGFLAKVFEVFREYQLSVDAVTTSEVSVAMTIDSQELKRTPEALEELSDLGEVSCEENLGLVALIGNRILETSGLGARIFAALGDINVRLICLGASVHNFCFLVSDEHAPLAVQRLHKEFIEK